MIEVPGGRAGDSFERIVNWPMLSPSLWWLDQFHMSWIPLVGLVIG